MYVFREIICRWYIYVYVRRRKKLACPEAVKAYYRMGLAYLARDQFDLAKVDFGMNTWFIFQYDGFNLFHLAIFKSTWEQCNQVFFEV